MSGTASDLKHECGLQGFDPYYDVCQKCETEKLIKEGLPEEDAREVAKLRSFSSGRPHEMGPIQKHFREKLRTKLASLGL